MTPKNITLLMVDAGNNVPQTCKTLNHCSKMLDWGAVRLFTYQKPPVPINGDVFMIPYCPNFPGDISNFMGGLGPCFFETEFMLYMHNDGYIIHPELWQDTWLEYDYVAPPWKTDFMKHVIASDPSLHRPTVGSGGFCIRSKRFAKAIAKMAVERNNLNAGQDFFECIMARERMIREFGIRYAPPEVGIQFGFEQAVDGFEGWTDDKSFGFHWLPGQPGRKML